ncbi:MAG: hypothetical protein IKB43_08085 [Fibrobacter sp.]|nr:hypothetical protein [Fibrobacter sp.]
MPDEKLQKELSMLFNLPHKKAIEYFEKKVALGPKKHWDWTDTMRHAHDRVFVVAKATSIDLVKDIHASLLKAIKEGKPYQDFANDIIPTLKEKGWWGNIDAVNKDQKLVKPIKVDHRRLRNIFNTNVKTAYAAGRYERMMEDADVAPYWRYVAVPKGAGNKNPRVEHAALHNLVFRYDDPFWQTHYAPNGWGCHCTVSRMTKRTLEKKFGKPANEVVRESKPEDFVSKTEEIEREHIRLDGTVETQKVKVTTTGYKVGNTVVYPSQGWDYAPGSYSFDYDRMLERKIKELPLKEQETMFDQLSSQVVNSFKNIVDVESVLNAPKGETFVAGMLPESVFNKLQSKKNRKGNDLNIESRLLTIDDKRIIHALRTDHPAIPKEVLSRLPELIKEWSCTYTPVDGLVFYSEPLKGNTKKRYKAVFGLENESSKRLVFKTGMVVDATAFSKKHLL